MTARRITSRRVAVALAGCLALAGCKTVEDIEGMVTSRPATPVIDMVAGKPPFVADGPRREKDIITLLSATDGIPDEPRIDSYLNGVLRRLAAKSPRDLSAARVYLFADPFPGAFVYPSGAIFLSHGLVEKLKDEDELAFILGHELGHVALDHFGSEWLETMQRYALLGGEAVLALQNRQAAGQGRDGGIPGWFVLGNLGTIMTRDMISPARSRSQEDEADQFGVDLMVRAGYDPGAAISMMGLMHQAEMEYGTADSVNLTTLEAALKEGWEDSQKTQGDGNLLSKGVDAILTGLGEAQREWRRNHKTAEERREGLNAYIDTWYETAAQPPRSAEALAAARAAAPTRQLFTSYEQARTFGEDIKALQQAKLKPKERQRRARLLEQRLEALTAGPVRQDSYVRLQLSRYWSEAARRDRAKQELRLALAAPTPSIKVYTQLAGLMADSGEVKDAAAMLDEAAKRFGDPAALFAPRIRAHAKSGNSTRATLLLAECKLAHPQLSVTCDKALKL